MHEEETKASNENCVMIKVKPTADPNCGFYIVKRRYGDAKANLNWEDESEWEVYSEKYQIKSYMLTHEQAEKLYNYDETQYWWNVTAEEREMKWQHSKWVSTKTWVEK